MWRQRSRGWARLVAWNALILLLLLISVNLLATVYVRATPQGFPQPNPARLPNLRTDGVAREALSELDASERDVHYMPFRVFRLRRIEGRGITVGADGNRRDPNGRRPPAGARVARFFGGSTMFGFGAADGQTIPAYFRRDNPGFRVVNHGVPAYTARQNLAHLLDLYAAGTRADLVVFYVGSNDVAGLCRRDVTLDGHPGQEHIRTILARNPGDSTRLGLAITTLLYGKTLELLRRELRSQRIPFRCHGHPSYARRVASSLLAQLRIAHDLVVAHGGRFIAALQPDAYVGPGRTDHIADVIEHPTNPPDIGLRPQFRAVYPVLRARIRAARQPWLVDLSRAFAGSRYIFIDHVHTSPLGNRIIARRLTTILARARAR